MPDFSCDVDVISAFTPSGALQMFTTYERNLQDLYFNMVFDLKTTYKKAHIKVDPSCDNKAMRANNTLIKKYENTFLKQEVDCVTNFQHERSNFYGLPKIHKIKIISKAIEE